MTWLQIDFDIDEFEKSKDSLKLENDERQRKSIQPNKNRQKGKLAEEWVKNTALLQGRIAKKPVEDPPLSLKG